MDEEERKPSTHRSGSEYIKHEIIKTGYPLEVEIFSIIKYPESKYRDIIWIPTAQNYFYDEEEKKGRSIDISAPRARILRKYPDLDIDRPVAPLTLNFNLAIECKKSFRNWVFFPIDEPRISIDGQILSFLENDYSISVQYYLSNFNNRVFHYYKHPKFLSSNFTILPEKGKDVILEAVMQLIKYITYRKYHDMKIYEKIHNSKYFINFWFPIIVFDGQMWEVYFEGGEVKDVIESKHTILKSKYKPIQSTQEVSFAIDIVHRSYFKEFIKIIYKDVHDFQNSFLENDKKNLNYIMENYKLDSRLRNRNIDNMPSVR